MLALLLLACSPPAATPPVEAPPAEKAAATVSTVTPAAAAPAPAAPATSKVYVTLVSHNEEQPNKPCTPVLTQEATYAANRAAVVKLARAVVEHEGAWDLQSDWEFLDAVKRWDTPERMKETDGKNLVEWVSHLDPTRIEVDAHAHERTHNYADVSHLIGQLGGIPNGVVGGFLFYPPEQEVWTRLRSPLKGMRYPEATWKAEILWGAATLAHGGPDSRSGGIWRPKSAQEFTEDSPEQSLVYVGNYQYSPEYDFTGVQELVSRVKSGELPAGRLYTANVFFRQCQLNDTMISAITAGIDALAPEVAAGHLVWSPLTRTVADWKALYASTPSRVDPLKEAPTTGPMGPKGPGGPMGPGGPRGPRPGGPGGGSGPNGRPFPPGQRPAPAGG